MAEPTPDQIQVEQTVNTAIQDPAVPKFYVNGFHFGQTASDVFIVSLLAGRPVGIQYMSFTAAKTLLQNLQAVIDNIETKTRQPILTMDEVHLRMTKGDEK